jgi:hypothetical protein
VKKSEADWNGSGCALERPLERTDGRDTFKDRPRACSAAAASGKPGNSRSGRGSSGWVEARWVSVRKQEPRTGGSRRRMVESSLCMVGAENHARRKGVMHRSAVWSHKAGFYPISRSSACPLRCRHDFNELPGRDKRRLPFICQKLAGGLPRIRYLPAQLPRYRLADEFEGVPKWET